MTILLNSALLNALVAIGLALLVWTAGTVPAVRRRPGLRHALWFIVLLKLVTPPVLEISILPTSLVAGAVQRGDLRAIPVHDIPPDAPAVSPVVQRGGAIPQEMLQAVPPARRIDWTAALALVSGLGTLVVFLLSIKQVCILSRMLARSASNDERLRKIARTAAQHMGLSAPPTVWVVSAGVAPLLWVRRSGPLAVIPRGLADQMSDEQLACVVSHEIAHYLRRDHWTNLLSLLVAAVCWWNPTVWWARRELRSAQESCCDALVVSRSVATRRVYAETLFQALEFVRAERSRPPALVSGFGGRSSTRKRFEMIANPRVNHRLSWWSYPVLVAALAVLPCVPVRGQLDEPKDPGAPQATQSRSEHLPDTTKLLNIELDLPYPGEIGAGYEGATRSRRDSQKTHYRLPDYLPAAHGNAVSAGGDRYYFLTPYGSDRTWYVQFAQDTSDGFLKTLWDATLKLPAEDELRQGDTFVLNTGKGIVTVAVVEDDYANDRDIGVRQIDVKTGGIKDERTLLRHMARYQFFLESMRGETEDPKENKDKPAASVLRADAKRSGNDLTLELECVESGNLIETALDFWRRVHGDTPVEQIRTSREDGKVRIIIKGKISSPAGSDRGAEAERPGRQGRFQQDSSQPGGYGDLSIGPGEAVDE